MKLKCPSCGTENMEGLDRCEQCLHSLVTRDLPKPSKDDLYQNALMTAPVSELVTGEDLLVADVQDSIKKIIEIFRKKSKNCVLVYQKKKLVGIISNRDLLRRVAGIHEDFSKLKAQDVMTQNPEAVSLKDPISFVVNKMAMGGFRHIPVLEADGTPLAIVNIHDVMHYLSSRQKH